MCHILDLCANPYRHHSKNLQIQWKDVVPFDWKLLSAFLCCRPSVSVFDRHLRVAIWESALLLPFKFILVCRILDLCSDPYRSHGYDFQTLWKDHGCNVLWLITVSSKAPWLCVCVKKAFAVYRLSAVAALPHLMYILCVYMCNVLMPVWSVYSWQQVFIQF